MSKHMQAVQAYTNAVSRRDPRAQEADVFRYANAQLKSARSASNIQRAKAIADNRRLWLAVGDLMRDPANVLPTELRASIVSLGLAVQREMSRPEPDFDFLISVNENIAAGLSERA